MPPSRPRLSVALCTYNGSQYLLPQLQSLAAQTRLPDELIVFDDASTDQTLNILQSFAGNAPFPVAVHVNSQTLGPSSNFQNAIQACTGQIIALCDQDDIWLPDKLSLTQSAFDRNPALGFVFGNANVCDENCRPLGYRLWESVRFGNALRRLLDSNRTFDVLVRQNVVTGATLAFASRFRPILLPIPSQWMHDGWIALLLAAVAPTAAIDQPLIRYRQHSRQSVGALQRTLYQQYLAARKMDRDVFQHQAEMYEAALLRLSEFQNGRPIAGAPAIAPDPRALNLLREKIRHCRTRSAIRRRECPRILPALIELATLRYRHFSLGWKSFAQDLFL